MVSNFNIVAEEEQNPEKESSEFIIWTIFGLQIVEKVEHSRVAGR